MGPPVTILRRRSQAWKGGVTQVRAKRLVLISPPSGLGAFVHEAEDWGLFGWVVPDPRQVMRLPPRLSTVDAGLTPPRSAPGRMAVPCADQALLNWQLWSLTLLLYNLLEERKS